MSRINKFVLTVSLLIFIMISAVACGIYTQMVKERVYGLKQSVIDTVLRWQILLNIGVAWQLILSTR